MMKKTLFVVRRAKNFKKICWNFFTKRNKRTCKSLYKKEKNSKRRKETYNRYNFENKF